MRAVLVATLPLSALLACIPPETEGDQSPCKSENHCVSQGRDFLCEAGYEWEDPEDEDNYNCVAIGGGEGEGEGPGVVDWGLPAGGHSSQGYYTTDGSGGVGSDKWTLVDMNGDRQPDLVITAETNASGNFVQLGFPNDGHWLVHTNNGGGFSGAGVNWTLPAGGHASQGYYAIDGSGGVGSGKWTLVDMDGDRQPDLVITAETDASGNFVQLGFPNDGHWLVHKNTGSGFASTGTKWMLPAGGHNSQGYYTVDGSGGVGGDKWSLLDMDGDQRPDLVLTAETDASGNFVQRGFPNDGHWLVHKNTGSGFARQ